ncbi:hypothetical protein D9M69_360070 [compost metagenome]
MALAGQQHHVVHAGAADQSGNGLTAAGDELDLLRVDEAGADVGKNLCRLFAARVVIGHQHPVGQALRHGRHQRTLATVAIATAAEQAEQAAAHVGTQGFQDFFQCIRGVGVIHHHQRLVAAAQTLHPAHRPLQRRQDLQYLVQRVVHGQQRTNYGQQVAQVEAPQQRAAQQALALRSDQLGAYAVVIEAGLAAIEERVGVFQAVAEQARLA